MPLIVHQSNRLESLAAGLAGEIRRNPLPPFVEEIVVVQSRGMARWLAMEVAGHNGCWANVTCPFPNAFVSDIFELVIGGEGFELESRETLVWRIMHLLQQVSGQAGFEDISSYTSGGDHKRFQLAWQLADRFDQYTVFRPESILGWEAGMDTGWQSELWRMIVKQLDAPHRARLQKDFLTIMQNPGFDYGILPPRVMIFGVSSLPPYHLEILHALSTHMDIRFFLMNPCQEYWSDIVSDPAIAKITSKGKQSAADLFLEKGNSLLASMGELGRDFFAMLQEYDCILHDRFDDSDEDSLLTAIQSDILNLKDVEESAAGKINGDNDNSIVIHACHSAMREVEVLQDHLLRLFDHVSDLRPKDILVMIPDIETYAPLIQAVFDKDGDAPMRIPFSIADRNIRKESNVVEALRATLALTTSRYGLTQVLGILEFFPVREKFGLQPDNMDLIETWLIESGIRWGMDRENRRRLDLPPFPENTWQAGIERLLLGYAMAGSDERLFSGILPYDHMEGSSTAVLGRFLDCITVLFEFSRTAREKHTLQDWGVLLTKLMDECFADDEETADEILYLRQVFTSLAQIQGKADFDEKVGSEVVVSFLDKTFAEKKGGASFLSGGVTFCAMLPMRSVPFKVVCLLGMNDKDYPRQPRRLSFDIMAGSPRRGDRSVRKDDRYLFLETILSARKQLYISYVGHSLREDGTFPPSVLVSELLDYIKGISGLDENTDNGLVIHHKLQPFDPEYFTGNTRLFSYSQENYQGAKIVVSPRHDPLPLVHHPLPPPSEEWRELTIKQLCAFFTHPVKYLCQRRLGIFLPEREETIEDIEPIALDRLEQYGLETEMLDTYLAGKDPDLLFAGFQAAGKLPPGKVGEVEFSSFAGRVVTFGKKIKDLLADTMAPSEVDLELGGFRLSGQLADIRENGQVFFRSARVKTKDLIHLWICHLAFNAVAGPNFTRQSVFAGTDCRVCYPPLDSDESRALLQEVIDLYWQGLTKPLPLFPLTSCGFAEYLLKGKEEVAALQDVRSLWHGNEYRPGERWDAYNRICFRDDEPFTGEFVALARQFYIPFLRHQEKERL